MTGFLEPSYCFRISGEAVILLSSRAFMFTYVDHIARIVFYL